MPENEGFVPFRGHRTWYRVVGDDQSDGKLPVVLLHGGPGATHDYLEPLEALFGLNQENDPRRSVS